MQMASKPMERFSNALDISEMQTKTTMRCHYTPTRTAQNKTKQPPDNTK